MQTFSHSVGVDLMWIHAHTAVGSIRNGTRLLGDRDLHTVCAALAATEHGC